MVTAKNSFTKTFKNVLGIIVSLIIIFSTAGICCGFYIDWRIAKKQEPIVRELVFLNCMFRVSLTEEQQKEAEDLFRRIDRIGKEK